jgi:hypothetical protein
MAMKHNLLTSAAVWPVSFGIVAGALGLAAAAAYAPCRVRCGPTRPAAQNASSEALNPVAAKRPANATAAIRLATSCSPCNPCAAAACSPCAAACSPCNPCAAANPCNPCDPCAPGAAAEATGCVVPSLQQAAACNPCAASKPAACNPCNPCAAKAACSPCNPCAAANPCNPCAAANPCNPCAAANPCNPCAANPCSPCAAAGEPVTVPDDEMQALYDCLKPLMLDAYGPGDHAASGEWGDWERFSTRAYVSGTHGGRFVQNYANDVGAEDYGKFEDVDAMPGGSVLAKPSFTVDARGEAALGPLFLMEKMADGWNADTADWRYAMVNADGSTFGVTGGQNSDGMMFCHQCHTAGQDADYLLFLPEEFRRP